MNRENMEKLAEFLEEEAQREQFHFNMRLGLTDRHHCGTAGCIAGAAFILERERQSFDIDMAVDADLSISENGDVHFDGLAKIALQWLGLESDKTFYLHRLFSPDQLPYPSATAAEAAIAVRGIINDPAAIADPWAKVRELRHEATRAETS